MPSNAPEEAPPCKEEPVESMSVLPLHTKSAIFGYLSELNTIEAEEFNWIKEIQIILLENRHNYMLKMKAWRAKVYEDITARLQRGDEAGASDIIERCLSKASVQNPHNFTVCISTGSNQQIYFKIIGTDDPSMSSRDIDQADNRSQTLADLHRLLDLATEIPATLSMRLPGKTGPPVIRFSDVVAQRQWIFWDKADTALCLTCSCPKIPVLIHRRSSSADAATHDVLPRYFRSDPIDCDNALSHFHAVHGYKSKRPEQVFTQHLLEVVNDDGTPFTDFLSSAMHNLAVKLLGDSIVGHWGTLFADLAKLEHERAKASIGMPATIDVIQGIRRTVSFATVEELDLYWFEYPGPGNPRWVVLCTCPTCTMPYFKEDPLKKERAIGHFRAHGLELKDDSDVIRFFGFKVAGVPDDSGAELHCVPESHEDQEIDRIVGRQIEWDEDGQIPIAMKYLIRWKDFGPIHDEWKTDDELTGASALVAEYDRANPVDPEDRVRIERISPSLTPGPEETPDEREENHETERAGDKVRRPNRDYYRFSMLELQTELNRRRIPWRPSTKKRSLIIRLLQNDGVPDYSKWRMEKLLEEGQKFGLKTSHRDGSTILRQNLVRALFVQKSRQVWDKLDFVGQTPASDADSPIYQATVSEEGDSASEAASCYGGDSAENPVYCG